MRDNAAIIFISMAALAGPVIRRGRRREGARARLTIMILTGDRLTPHMHDDEPSLLTPPRARARSANG